MRKYDFNAIEAKWRARWEQAGLFRTPARPRKKLYVLEMFAYPSGDIHLGHFRNYSIGDVVARHRVMAGYDVLHPFGWDAFGQPAEGAAIKHGIHPRDWTLKNIQTGRETLKNMALTFDWEREFITCDPSYMKWAQWIFLLLFERGLAYQAPSMVNWCPVEKTILANEQARDGKCWRDGAAVEKKQLEQCWFFKYSTMAQRLLDDLDKLKAWPPNILELQRHWIGRSEGAELDFSVDGRTFSVFTTRPDTVYGVTFMAVAPESPYATQWSRGTPQQAAVDAYIKKALLKSEIDRAAVGEKDGVYLGRDAINPFNGKKVRLYVADYVIAGYGTGIVMGVPAHDQRDFEFAKKYGIPIEVVIQPPGGLDAARMTEAFVEEGMMVNSGPFDGTPSGEGIRKVTEYAASKGWGRARVTYRLRDWLISRQRYWGCPIPIIHCGRCGPVGVPREQLPVTLPPDVKNFIPEGRSPLADCPDWVRTTCPKCGGAAQRDVDTMDTFMDSSFYQFRFTDPHNDRELWSKQAAWDWLPVDIYIGGAEHACMHLLYFRFITKVLFDAGLVPTDEPAVRLFNQGMLSDERGETMSKSKGNAVSPRDLFARWGLDVSRLAMFFFAPSEDEIRWSEQGLVGAQRFVNRLWAKMEQAIERPGTAPDSRLVGRLHRTIRRVTRAMEEDFHFNTAIAAIMELLNAWKPCAEDRQIAATVARLIAPLAPFLGEEFWEALGNSTSVFRSDWPAFDPALAREEEVTIVVQVNGKKRADFAAAPGTPEAELQARALAAAGAHLDGKTPRKVIVVPDRLVNIVV
jgi:leucyl-tRNA synthetase